MAMQTPVAEVRLPDVLTTSEAAALLRLNPYTITRLARAGILPGRKTGKDWRFSKQALIHWVCGSKGRVAF